MSADQNHETHLVRLWMMTAEESYRNALGLARDVVDATDGVTRDGRADGSALYPAVPLAAELREWFEGEAPEVEGVWHDLHTLALDRVDWVALAHEFLTDVGDES